MSRIRGRRSQVPREFAPTLGSCLARSRRLGFTYAESMITLVVLSLAGAALLTSVAGAVHSSNDAIYRSVGQGLADQLLDEIAAAKFPDGSASTLPSQMDRSAFATIDDYSGWTESPPRTKSGEVLGDDRGVTGKDSGPMIGMWSGRAAELRAAPGFVQRFTRSVLVERVQPGAAGWTAVAQHTPHRRVTVTVAYTASNQPARPVASAMRVFSAVPPTP